MKGWWIMTDREKEILWKVILGLECCSDVKPESCVKRCPYKNVGCNDARKLMQDALALLKEQEPAEPKEIVNENLCVGEPYRTIGWECGNCGADIDSLYKYCPHCGRAVKWE